MMDEFAKLDVCQQRTAQLARSIRADRTDSLHNVTGQRRSLNLSASTQAALSDSNLTVQAAVPSRNYDSSQSDSKTIFSHLMRRYYYQLTVGCGNTLCKNTFCCSCSRSYTRSRCHKPEFAVLMSMELASRSEPKFLCSGCRNRTATVQLSELDRPPEERSFLQSLFLTSPFKSLLTERLRRHSADYMDSPLLNHDDWTPKTHSRINKRARHLQGSSLQSDFGETLDLRPSTTMSTSVDWSGVEVYIRL
jgi:hypothetical protein